jgi:hypothetical protein
MLSCVPEDDGDDDDDEDDADDALAIFLTLLESLPDRICRGMDNLGTAQADTVAAIGRTSRIIVVIVARQKQMAVIVVS